MKQTWRNNLVQFMKGRYGYFDSLNKLLLILAIILLLLPIQFIHFGAYLLLVVAYYRFFSKKIYVRSNENQKYNRFKNRLFKRFNHLKTAFKQRKNYAYFRCPECKQQLRAPRGRGKIKITCAHCHQQFVKKV